MSYKKLIGGKLWHRFLSRKYELFQASAWPSIDKDLPPKSVLVEGLSRRDFWQRVEKIRAVSSLSMALN